MHTVTPTRSAVGVIRLSPVTQFASPSASDIPSRLPEKTIMFGSPAAATSGSSRSDSATNRSCSLGRLRPTRIVVGPLAMAQVSPYDLTVAQSFSPSSSTEARPMRLAAAHSSSSGILS